MTTTTDWQESVDARLEDESLYRRAIQVQLDVLMRTSEEQTEQIESIRGELLQNTKATDEVVKNTGEMVDLFHAFQGGIKVLEVIGKAAKPLAAIASLGAAIGAYFINWKGGK